MNSKRKCRRWICHGLIVVMMVSIMGPIFSMMAENQTYAYTRTMNVTTGWNSADLLRLRFRTKRPAIPAEVAQRHILTGIFLERDIKVRRVCIVQITLPGVFSDTR